MTTSEKKWFILVGNQQSGPLTAEEVQVLRAQRKVAASDMAKLEGTNEWQSVGDIRELIPTDLSVLFDASAHALHDSTGSIDAHKLKTANKEALKANRIASQSQRHFAKPEKKKSKLRTIFLAIVALMILTIALILAFSGDSQADETPDLRGEKIDVGALKEKYWAKGDESQLRVVQNRLYTKTSKLELGVFGGTISTDPFLDVSHLGASLGYHFSESFCVNALAWKSFVKQSSALETLETLTQSTAATNHPRSFVGGEASYSPLYGKLSVLGKAIIYFDLHLLAGAGMTATESGNYFTPVIGIGQQIFLSKWLSFRFDLRNTFYTETVLFKTPAQLGQPAGNRSNSSSIVSLGFTVFFDPFK